MSRKRKDSSQNTTLFDYFASSSKKTRRTPSKTPWKKPSSAAGGNIEEDVIVISSDVEPDQEDSHADHKTATEAYVTSIYTAGKEAPVEALDTVQDNQDTISENQIESVSELCDISNIPLENHWDFRDDEAMEDLEEEVGDLATDTQSVCGAEPRDEKPESSCPICMTSLKGLSDSEIERHVDMCLDIPSAEAETSRKIASSSNVKQLAKTAFSVLMSGYQDTKAWKEATEAENRRGGVTGRRSAPFYKVLQGMPIAVDAFRYGKIPGVTAYFLTHAHSDHYTNLSSSWKNGLIYCSQTTANLVIQMLKVNPKLVKPLPLDIPIVVPDTGGVKVTLIQANHCPGSVLFLFEGRQTVNAGDSTFRSPHIGSSKDFRYLHCGDFRACPKHIVHDQIKGAHIDAVYLDTTYLDPRYCFPPQPLVISACADLARRLISPDSTPTENGRGSLESIANWLTGSEKGKEKERSKLGKERTLVVVGTYTIGKERIVKAIAKSLSTKVYCDSRKLSVLNCIDDPELHQLLTNNPMHAGIHIVPLHMIVSDRLSEYLEKWKGQWTKIIGFRPTGWTYTSNGNNVDNTFPSIPHIISRDQARDFTHANLRLAKNSSSRVLLYNVPYSEHSSFFELTCFAMSLDWGKIIATVNVGNPRSRGKMEKWFEKWRAERTKRLRDEGSEFVQYRSIDYW